MGLMKGLSKKRSVTRAAGEWKLLIDDHDPDVQQDSAIMCDFCFRGPVPGFLPPPAPTRAVNGRMFYPMLMSAFPLLGFVS